MSAIAHDTQQHDWETPEHDAQVTPGRPRRRFLNRKSAALAAAITCIAGFLAGVDIEKSQLSNTATAATSAGAAGASGGAGAGARAGFLGGAGGGGNASIGTIASVNGKTVYLTDSSGNTVKVTLSSATKITKSTPVSKTSVRPGDTVVIQGLKNSNGTITATSVSDNGAGATRPATGTGANGTAATTSGTAG
jgi:hypothetical protein